MHLRISTPRSGSKSYRYVQIVQSYRRPKDGMPAHRVIANLGDLSPVATENLRRALAAARRGQSVLLPAEATGALQPVKVQHNLAWLDVAVCFRTWCSWELTELIDELAGASNAVVSSGEVIAALTVQRCVEPASKRKAFRWFARTALPELQGIAPGRFNNTRIHRALAVLERVEASLQQHLARRVAARMHPRPLAALFLDCSDTWFVGQGPDLAYRGRTKEGLIRRRIGIALMCEPHGLPLRWATLPGNHHEATTMMEMIDEVRTLAWAQRVPIIADRAMGRGVTVESLLERDVRFITAVPFPEIRAYSHRIPLGKFDELSASDEESPGEDGAGEAEAPAADELKALRQRALELGFEAGPGHRYLLDLGVIVKGEGIAPVRASWLTPSRAKASLQIAQNVRDKIAMGDTLAAEAKRCGCTVRQLQRWLEVLALDEEVQQRVLAGDADRITIKALTRIAGQPAHEQIAAFEQERQEAAERPVLLASRALAEAADVPMMRVRVVVRFNPEGLIEQRETTARAVSELENLVERINTALRSPRSKRSRASAIGEVSAALRKRGMLDLFEVSEDDLVLDERSTFQLRLVRDDEDWQRRRSTNGIMLLVAHPAIEATATELAELYFAKDQVEKDFQAIKSALGLRPVNHQTDSKVRAHVSLCVLALLLERTLERHLRERGAPMTAEAVLDELKSGHLNLHAGGAPLYSATIPDAEQRRILKQLDMEDLADDDAVARTLTPR